MENKERQLSMCRFCVHNGTKSCKGLANCNFTLMTDDTGESAGESEEKR